MREIPAPMREIPALMRDTDTPALMRETPALMRTPLDTTREKTSAKADASSERQGAMASSTRKSRTQIDNPSTAIAFRRNNTSNPAKRQHSLKSISVEAKS